GRTACGCAPCLTRITAQPNRNFQKAGLVESGGRRTPYEVCAARLFLLSAGANTGQFRHT
ncbi:MAG: hypothetical protein WCG26_03650, partial [Chloroflexales bacterium]